MDQDLEKAESRKRDPWLTKAYDAFESSTTYIDNNYRRQWENNIRHFNNKHASGSKYYTAPYQYRSRLFRPKTRAMERSNEAAAAAAFFTNSDAVDVEARNTKNPKQRFSAELRDGLINYHLDETIPWFLILCGGMQDAQVQGCVVSKQYWDLQHEYYTGQDGVTYKIVTKDEPVIDLHPIENVRIDPSAKWYDPINSSPYVILQEPMYITDVQDKIERGEFIKIDDKLWHQALVKPEDTTRQARHDGRQDSSDINYSEILNSYSQVWVHENFVRHQGKDYVYFTLGTIARLTNPRPLADVYWHNRRPISLGHVIVQTHTAYKPGTVELSAPLQKEINEVTNTRQDNIKFVLNKRYIVGRGKQVDLQSLIRNAPGSITMANDVDADVRVLEFNDVTASSFAEHDRLSVEYDELVGNFSGASVQSNRKLNETVGGLAMLRGTAGQMTQYLIDVFGYTWVQDVVSQLDALIQEYESDIELMDEIAQDLDLYNKYDIKQITPELLKERVRIKVNVTNSATDPLIRLEQFLLAVQKYNEIAAAAPMDMDLGEIRKEIFGRLGYRSGNRFFVDPDSDVPMVVMQLQQQIQQLTQVIEGKQVEEQGKTERAVELERVKGELARELEAMKQAGENNRQGRELDTKRQLETDKLFVDTRTTKQVAKLESDTDIATTRMKINADQRKQLGDNRTEAANNQVQSQIDALFERINGMEREEQTETEEEGFDQEAFFTELQKVLSEKDKTPQEIHVHLPGEKSKKIDITRKDGQITGAEVTSGG